MGFDTADFAARLARRTQRLLDVQTTQPNVPEGLPPFSPTPGQQLPNVQTVMAAAWVLVGLKTLANGADSLTTAPVPQTTKSLMVVVRSGGAPTASALLGIPSQTNYFTPVGTIRGVTQIPVNGLEDAVYKLTFSAGAVATVAIYASDNIVPSISQGAQSSTRSVPVTLASDQPNITPWLAAINKPVEVGGAGVLVAANAAQNLYLFSVSVAVTAAVAASEVQVQDDNSVVIAVYSAAAVGNAAQDFHGAPIGLGRGLKTVLAGGAPTVRTTIAYSQA